VCSSLNVGVDYFSDTEIDALQAAEDLEKERNFRGSIF